MTEYLIVLVILFLFALLRELLRSKKKAQGAAPVYRATEPEHITALMDDAVRRLETIGADWLMQKDYTFRVQITPPGNTSFQETERQLQQALIEILSHLHQLPNVKLFVTTDPHRLSHEDWAGEYSHGFFNKTIRILIRPEYSAKDVLLTLCHEATHYFMYSYNLNDPNSDRNETLTDIMAVLLGFGPTMIAAKSIRNPPYLSHPEFKQVYQLLLHRRTEMQNARRQSATRKASREQLRKNISGARAMIQQVQAMIAVNKAPQANRMSKSAFAAIQGALLALESGEYVETLNRAEAALSADADTVRAADAEVLSICGALFQVMLAFQ